MVLQELPLEEAFAFRRPRNRSFRSLTNSLGTTTNQVDRGFSIVFFACGCHAKAPQSVKDELQSLGLLAAEPSYAEWRFFQRGCDFGGVIVRLGRVVVLFGLCLVVCYSYLVGLWSIELSSICSFMLLSGSQVKCQKTLEKASVHPFRLKSKRKLISDQLSI